MFLFPLARGEKPLRFRGSSFADYSSFPFEIIREAGFQLNLVQFGLDPSDWKPMTSVGRGVAEIRLRDAEGIYRVFYVARFAEAIYVLHAFEKTTQKTDKKDIELGKSRLSELLAQRKEQGYDG